MKRFFLVAAATFALCPRSGAIQLSQQASELIICDSAPSSSSK